jgi:hypothetical protein
LECPRTVDAVAEHFMRHHIGHEAIRFISQLPTPDSETYTGADLIWTGATPVWKRRITYIYGVATNYGYGAVGGERGGPGWNRRLLDDCQAKDPEEATREIFNRVWEKARDGAIKVNYIGAKDGSEEP